jgi:peptidoglycan/LPS O-acetylase OafA/YrhL
LETALKKQPIPTISKPLNRVHYPALDGMRGLAVLLVVVYHNFNFINYTFFGWLGVDLFFVLSGFLITEILLQSRETSHFLRNFYIRRALRIFPLYFLTLFFFLTLLPLFTKLPGLDYYLDNQTWLWFYLQNWLYIFKPPPMHSLTLSHLWSLAVEEQFYLIWPFVILLIRKPKTILLITICLLVGVIVLRFYLWVNRIENLSYYNLFTFSRIDGICIGSTLALLRKINPKAITQYFTVIVLFLAALNFLFYFFNRQHQYTYPYLAIAGYTTFAMLFGILVHEGISEPSNWIRTIFANPVFRFFGRISFGLYVLHWPIYVVLKPQILKWWQTNFYPYAEFMSSVLLTLLAIGLSLASYYFFELKFLKLKAKFTHL